MSFCITAKSQSTAPPKDSLLFYKRIEEGASKKKFTYRLYRIVFRPIKKIIVTKKVKSKNQKPVSFKIYNGKIIRHIIIHTNDPFGYDIRDTAAIHTNFLTKAGNDLHAKTRQRSIKNQLLFAESDTIDELRLFESERLLRQTSYIKDVVITVHSVGKDSVDVDVTTIDVFTTHARIGIAYPKFTIIASERSMFGLGHQLDNNFKFNTKHVTSYEGAYTIPNIYKSYVSASVFTNFHFTSYYEKGISINRPFFSPLTRWAGGVYVLDATTRDSTINADRVDVWGGKSWPIFKHDTTDNRSTNFILATRYLNNRFDKNLADHEDSLHLFASEDFYLASVGISQRIYVSDKYIFKFGLPEDVPTGKTFSLTIGEQYKHSSVRTYMGARAAWGNYISDIGFFALNLEYGTFFRSQHAEQGVFSSQLIYFTPLMSIGRWKIRQFVKPRLTLGIDRFATDAININDDNGIRGFNSSTLTGKKRFTFSLQTQAYAPYSWLGFQFAPAFYFTGAFLASTSQPLFNGRFYSSFAFGILFRNEYLLLNTFQISGSFYPYIPDVGSNKTKLNNIKTYNFQFSDFDTGLPQPVGY